METKNLPAAKTQEAVTLVQKYKSENQLVFVAEEDLKTQTMFLPEVVVIHSTPDDFHNISGNYMPKRHQVDRIADASGISFLTENCGTRTEQVDGSTVYVGFAQGKKRMPDGTWRTSSVCEYEFSPVKRAEEDALRKPDAYKTEKDKKLAVLNYQKFGRQRADTGARLRVIRELTGIPTAFKPEEIKRAMVFSRVSINTDQLLADPEMRQAAIRIATGASEQIYGPEKLTKLLPVPESNGETMAVDYEVHNGEPERQSVTVPWEEEQKSQESAGEQKNKEMIEELRAARQKWDKELPKDAKGIIDDLLKQEKPDPATVSSLIDKVNDWETRYTALRGVRK
jgi:hypothetical protein